jgi:hypothetical protein
VAWPGVRNCSNCSGRTFIRFVNFNSGDFQGLQLTNGDWTDLSRTIAAVERVFCRDSPGWGGGGRGSSSHTFFDFYSSYCTLYALFLHEVSKGRGLFYTFPLPKIWSILHGYFFLWWYDLVCKLIIGLLWNKWYLLFQKKSLYNFLVSVKGTVSRDIPSSVFFIKQLLLVPIGMPRNDFELFSNIHGVKNQSQKNLATLSL